MPRHFEAVVAVRVAEPTSTWAFFGTLPCECGTRSHLCHASAHALRMRKIIINITCTCNGSP